MENKPFVLAIVGATASGKTWLGVEMAKNFNGEVISADSMQIYKGLDIASAKPTQEEMQGIPHHLIDFLERDVSFSAADYVKLANEKNTGYSQPWQTSDCSRRYGTLYRFPA